MLELETALARASMTPVQMRDPAATYHKMAAAELQRLTPHLDWAAYLRAGYEYSAGYVSAMSYEARKLVDYVGLYTFLFMLATLALQDENASKAERLLRRVLSYNPNLSTATTLLVSMYVSEGKTAEGLALIEKSLASTDWPDDGLDLDILKAQLQLSSR